MSENGNGDRRYQRVMLGIIVLVVVFLLFLLTAMVILIVSDDISLVHELGEMFQ